MRTGTGKEARERGFHPRTLGAGKYAATRECIGAMRQRTVTPHGARNTTRRRSASDGRTPLWPGSLASQRLRTRVAEVLGWMKTIAGLRHTRSRGLARTQVARTHLAADLVAVADNLVRMARLAGASSVA
jgi:hypothetical protein